MNHNHLVNSLAISTDYRYLVSGSYDNSIKIFDFEAIINAAQNKISKKVNSEKIFIEDSEGNKFSVAFDQGNKIFISRAE